jgi:hypothetical protein
LFRKNKKIKFFSSKTEVDLLKPFPASKAVPDWYRKMPRVIEGIQTVKTCVPVLDILTAGYMIPLPASVKWDEASKDFLSQTSFEINSDHYPTQTQGVPVSEEYDPQPHKWINYWFIKTPPGYSTLFIHPANRQDLPFYSFSGIVDTDKHPLIINFPFLWKKDFRGIVPAGTPMIQAIPFKRDDWTSEVIDTGPSYDAPESYLAMQPPFAWYKRTSWSKKRFS